MPGCNFGASPLIAHQSACRFPASKRMKPRTLRREIRDSHKYECSSLVVKQLSPYFLQYTYILTMHMLGLEVGLRMQTTRRAPPPSSLIPWPPPPSRSRIETFSIIINDDGDGEGERDPTARRGRRMRTRTTADRPDVCLRPLPCRRRRRCRSGAPDKRTAALKMC